MGCGASASQTKTTVWACQYCGLQFPTFEACEAHEKVCASNPSAVAAKPAPIAVTAAPAAAKASPKPAGVTGAGNAGGNLQDFLTGLGIRDVPKATEALLGAGIETRGDFFNLDKDMRQELDEELKKAGVNLGDRAKLKKAENAAVSVKQGNGEVSVLMLQPGQAMQTTSGLIRVFLGLGWAEKNPSKKIDVDASCIGFASGQQKETIYFGNLGNATKSLKHTGDILVGSEKGKAIPDLERIYVWLPNVPAEVDCLVFVANVYTSGMDFKDLESAYIRMANADTNQELARLSLGGGGMKGNALVFAKVYRCGPKGPWHFHTLGMPLEVPGCAKVDQMIPQLQLEGCADIPPGANQGKPAIADVPAAAAPAGDGKKKTKTPTGVYVAGALAVASVAGVAAATAIFMSSDLDASNFTPSIFEDGVDFGSLVPSDEAITGIGEGIAEGAEGAYEWAAGVTESVDFGAVGDTIGSAVGDAGDAIGGVAGDAADAIGGAAGDIMGSDAMGAVGDGLGDAAGAVGDVAGDAAGAMGDVAGDAAGAIGDAAPGAFEAIGGVAEGAGGAIGGAAESVMENAPGIIEGAMDAIGGLLGGIGGMLGGD